jgi:hypothetical protein
MLATPMGQKRVLVLADILKARNFTLDQVTRFVEHWMSTQSKFPVLADFYAFTGLYVKQDAECSNGGNVVLELELKYNSQQHLAKLHAINCVIDKWVSERHPEKFCCYLKHNQGFMWEIYTREFDRFSNGTPEMVNIQLNYTQYRCNNGGRNPNSFRNERGCYNSN